MYRPHNSYAYRFDNFLEEARNLINKSKAAVYFHLVFSDKYVWQDLGNLMEEYSEDERRKWKVALLRTQQDDFYILQFADKDNEEERHSFFWKIIMEGDKVTILSFSLEKFRFIVSCLETLSRMRLRFPTLCRWNILPTKS